MQKLSLRFGTPGLYFTQFAHPPSLSLQLRSVSLVFRHQLHPVFLGCHVQPLKLYDPVSQKLVLLHGVGQGKSQLFGILLALGFRVAALGASDRAVHLLFVGQFEVFVLVGR